MTAREREIIGHLKGIADPAIAAHSQRFFKTGEGEYGEGDRFLGIRVPMLRAAARQYRDTTPEDAFRLLASPYHEARLLALFILVALYRRADPRIQVAVYRGYLGNTDRINNWDLVDSSAEHIVGAHLWTRRRTPLNRLARSASLWERRIAIMATFHFIKKGDFADTLRLATMLLADTEDLIHKAVGWMLREVGNRNRETEEAFLAQHAPTMPRTMLRYAIEKFPEPLRQAYLTGKRCH